jgi:uncharacterized protein (TIGR00252 family)
MRLAIAQLPQPPEHVLVDGGHLPASPFPETAVADGDARSLSIAAASVVAKVERDRAMVEWDSQYPRYGFARHKGYGTEEHLAALRAHGPCPLHRRSFAPVRELAGEPGADGYRGFAAALVASADTQQLEAVARRIRAGRQALGPAELEALRRLYRRQRQRWADPGRRAEDLAARYLEERGYAILERGYRGAGGEIDLVARQGDCLVFVEVKSAWGRRLGRPEERVDAAKQGHLVRAARQYLLAHDLKGDCRFDVVVIEGSPEGPRFTHLVSAFQASA